MDFEKYASEAVALYKEAGVLDDYKSHANFYKDKPLRKTFVYTMDKDDIKNELEYLDSDAGIRANKSLRTIGDRLGGVAGGVIGGASMHAATRFSPKGLRAAATLGGIAAGGALGYGATHLADSIFGTNLEMRRNLLQRRYNNIKDE